MNTNTLPLFDNPYALPKSDKPFEPFCFEYVLAFGVSYADYCYAITGWHCKNQSRDYFAAYSAMPI